MSVSYDTMTNAQHLKANNFLFSQSIPVRFNQVEEECEEDGCVFMTPEMIREAFSPPGPDNEEGTFRCNAR